MAVASRPLRVLQVISSSATSGAEKHVLQLTQLLRSRGHDVEVVCPAGGWLADELAAAGIPTHAIAMKGGSTLAAHLFMLDLIKGGRYDLMHAHLTRAAYLGFFSGALRGVPLVASVHIDSHDRIYRFVARRKNRLVAVSNYVRGVLHGMGVPDRYVDTVYNGTDFADAEPSDREGVLAEFGIPRQRKVVGLVGRVCREKGHMIAVEALPRVLDAHPDTQLMFVGRFNEEFEPEIREAVLRLGVGEHVTFTGNRRDVARMFDAMAFSILPSSIEACPLAALESMARSRALVASRVGGLSELVLHEETGLLVDQDPVDLATAMRYLLAHDAERERMGLNARRWVEERFTHAQMLERFEAVYSRVAGQS